jgi:hypothetical protein
MRAKFPTTLVTLLALCAEPAEAQLICSNVLEFNGLSQFVSVPYDASFPTEVFTASAWIRAKVPNKRGAIISRGEDAITGNSSWTLLVAQSGFFEVMLEDANDDNQILSSGTFVADNSWHHVAASRSAAGAMTLYVDGQAAAQFSGTNVPSSNNQRNLSIGCTYGVIGPPPPPPPPAWFFKGRIDQPAMWNVVLTADEISTLALRGVDPLSNGLVGYWPLEEGAGQVVSDLSPAGNDGYLGAQGGIDGADPQWETRPADLTRYCVAAPNSVGAGALVDAIGSTSFIANQFTILASAAPPKQFFHGTGQAQIPVGEGFLCIAKNHARLPVVQVNNAGVASYLLDLSTIGGGVLAGDTRSFQFWYRDSVGTVGYNFSDAIEVVFCP